MRAKVLIVGLLSWLFLSIHAMVWVGDALSQLDPEDSTEAKLLWARVKFEVKTSEDYEYLEKMGIDCPERGGCEVIVNRWQMEQLRERGFELTVLERLRPDEGPNQVEYQLVKEIDLKSDGVGFIVFGPKKGRSSALSEIILGMKDKGVCIYDSDFNLLQKITLNKITYSKNLRYIGGIEYVSVPQDVTEKSSYKFLIFDYTGKKLWELERELHYDASPNTYSISSKGYVIEKDHLNGILTFFDPSGNEIKKIQLYRGTWDPGGQGVSSEFSEDGEYLLITAQDDDGHVFGEGIGVILFTQDGEELWRFTTNEGGTGKERISRLGNYVIVSSHVFPYTFPFKPKNTYILSREGTLTRKLESQLATDICISSDEKYVLITSDSWQALSLISLESGETIFKYNVKRRNRDIYSTDIAQDASMFGLISCYSAIKPLSRETEGKERNIEALLIDFRGRKVWSKTYPFQGGPLFRMVNLTLSDDGKQMAIQIGSKVMIYQQVE